MRTAAPTLPVMHGLVAGLAALLVFVWLIPVPQVFHGLGNYLPLHGFVEVVSIVIAVLVFGVVWNSESRERSGNLVVLACALLAVALIDFAHTLSYAGMPEFVTPSDPEKAIFFWLAARAVAAAGLLAAAWRAPRALASPRTRYGLLAAALGVVLLTYWIGLFHQQELPRTFVAGTGLTPAKIGAEWVLIALFAAAAALFHRRARSAESPESAMLFAASAVSALSEVFFTLYAEVTDIFNVLGHVYKIVAYSLVYRAVFVASVRAPFDALRESEQRYGTLITAMAEGIVMQDASGAIVACNRSAERILGLTREQMLGMSSVDPRWQPIHEDGSPFPGESHPAMQTLKTGIAQTGVTMGIRKPDGSLSWISINSQALTREGEAKPYAVVTTFHDITERKEGERALRESEAGLRHAQEMARISHVIVRPDGSYERWSEGWPRLMGLQAAQLPRTTREALALVHPEDRDRFRAAAIEAGRSGSRSVLDYRMHRSDGALLHIHQTMEPLGEAQADGRSRWFVTLQDVTEERRAADRIHRLNRIYAVLSGINAAIVRIRDRQELFDEVCRIAAEAGRFRIAWIGLVDPAAQRVRMAAAAGDVRDYFDTLPAYVLETKPGGEALIGRAVREKKPAISNDVRGDPQRSMRPELLERDVNAIAAIPLLVGGEPVGVLSLLATETGFFDDEEMRLLLELAGDVSFALDHIEKEEKVRYLAYYDPLTGLANRSLLLERLAQALSAASREGQRLALLIFNIERFKTINDGFGRQVGDALLREVAQRLLEHARDPANLARVGSDVFAVILPNLRGEDWLIQRLEEGHRHIDGAPYRAGGNELRIATRAGIAVFPADGTDAETLFRNAEAALKKTASGEAFLFYAPHMTERVAERLGLENELRLALEREEFVLHYQPKVDLEQRRLVGFEALIRWQSPKRGLVPPLEFIPLLEETGLILGVGAWALRRAALDHRAWAAKGFAPPRIAVNVSALQLRQRDFVAIVSQAIAGGEAPTGIDLEITESAVMDSVDANIEKLKALRSLGVQVAIDDFGTGYSSLGYLAKLPVQSLKIDRSFVAAMATNSDAMSLVSTIISLARSLRLRVIAEGVEDETQAKFLQLLLCDEAQGYLFGRPMAAESAEALLPRGG